MSDFQPTPAFIIEAIVSAAAPLTLSKVFYDLGSGDGRVVKAFADGGATAKGIETDSVLNGIATNYLSGVPNATIIEGDIFAQDVSDGTHFWISINYRTPTDRLADLKAMIPSNAFVIVNDLTWGWPIVNTVDIPEQVHTTAMELIVRGSHDWDLLRDLTVQQILDTYEPIVHPHKARVGAKSFPIYKAP